MPKTQTAIIIGAGPAGLTAGYELLKDTNIKPIIYEASNDIGGISKTVKYKGNRIDIGGHRFFSKSDKIMEWWQNILPIESTKHGKSYALKYQGKERILVGSKGLDPKTTDDVMLVRSRLSRILYGGKFYDYPISLDLKTLKNLGLVKIIKIGFSYLYIKIKPRSERNLEDFYINRFGKELYKTFFKDYTEKVWGVPCTEIAADWGAQRVKGLSITKTVKHAVLKLLSKNKSTDISQKKTETTLIEKFLYPKLGPGHMWEKVAKIIIKKGGRINKNVLVTKIHVKNSKIIAVSVRDKRNNSTHKVYGDYFISTMPINELISSIEGVNVPAKIFKIANGLPFRDFITVGLLLKKLAITDSKNSSKSIQDNWIYIQEPEVKVGRLQIFNNWSPYLVKDKKTTWIGLEYFVNENDDLWRMKDKDLVNYGISELEKIKIIDSKDVIDSTVIRIKKTYPAYFGTYSEFYKLRKYMDTFENLFLIGRNGQHKYNNQDHSMLTAMEAVNNMRHNVKTKQNIWDVNTEEEYHEHRTA